MATILGNSLRNKLLGTGAADKISGLGGDDLLLGNGGNDTIKGGTGNDTIDGGAGNDKIFGEAGNDKIKGGAGLDTIDGGAGNDTIDGGTGNDTVKGGSGNDSLKGGAGNDLIGGGLGTDTAVFSGLSTASVISQVGSILFISGPNGVDRVLSDVESITFSNGTFSAVAKTVTLTANTDLAPATTGSLRNDTYIGSVDTGNPAATTFNTGDSLDGAIGTADRLNLALSGNATPLTLTGTQLANIEIVQVQNTNVLAGVTFDAALWTGVASIVLNASLAGSNTLFTNLVNVVGATMQGGNAGNLSLGYGAGVLAGGLDVQSLTLAGSQEGSLFSVTPGAETLNIASNAGAVFRNSVTIDGTNLHQTINITGTHHLDLDLDNATSVTTIDASGYGNAGDQLLIFNIGVSIIDITGSGFDDEFIFSSDSLTSADAIGGGGGTDGVGFTDDTTLVDADLVNVTSIERLLVGSPGGLVTLDATIGTNALAMGLTTVDAADNGQVNLIVAAGFTGPLLVNLDSTDPLGLWTDGADSVNGSAMTGRLVVQGLASSIDAGDAYTGGININDELQLRADGGTANLSLVSGFELLTVKAGFDPTDDIAITVGTSTVVGTGGLLFVDASELTNSAAQLTFNGSAETATIGRFKVLSGAGDDNIIGGDGNDELIGGGGADFFDGGLGDDTLTGGDGNDVIDAGVGIVLAYGDETVTGGNGDDVIAIDAVELTNDDSIDGGANTDTLLITDEGHVNDGDLANVTTVEVLSSAGFAHGFADKSLTATLGASALASGIRTLTSGAGVFNDDITVGVDFTAALTVNIGAGADEVLAGGTTANVTVNASASNVTAADFLIGGSDGGDVLALVAGGTSDLANVSGFETLSFSGTAATSVTLGANTVGNLTNQLVVSSSSVTGGLTLNASALTSGTKSINLASGSGIDSITASEGADTISTDAGNDTITIGANLTSGDTIDGGAGTGDKLRVNAGTNDASYTNVSNVEILELLTAGNTVLGVQANNSGLGIKSVIGTSGDDVVLIGTGFGATQALAVSILAGNDTVDAQDGLLGSTTTNITVNALESDLTNLDTLRGGTDGGDILNLTASSGSADLTTTSDFETINIVAQDGIAVDLLFGNGTVEDNVRVTVNASGMIIGDILTVSAGGLTALEALTINVGSGGSTITTGAGADIVNGGIGSDFVTSGDGIDQLFGDDGDDILLAGAGNDSMIDGGDGDDDISGGAGNDTINAGIGADDVVVVVGNGSLSGFSSSLNLASANGLDTINVGVDSDQDRLIFDLDVVPTGVSVASNFDAALSNSTEDRVAVETGSAVDGWAEAGSFSQLNGGAASDQSLIILDNGNIAFGLANAVIAADGLQTGSSAGESYLFAWSDGGGLVHISYATVDAGDTANDQAVDLVTLSGVTLSQLDLGDFDFIV